MSLRPCFAIRVSTKTASWFFVEPFLSAKLTKEELVKLWHDASVVLGQVRKKIVVLVPGYHSRSDHLVKHGLAATWLRTGATRREACVLPCAEPELVWGGRQAEELGLVRSSLAQKTPRVQTIEKAHIERAVVDGKQDDIDRIEVWGQMQREVWSGLTKTYWPVLRDPFKGCPVISIPVGWDPRTCPGKTVVR